MSEAAIKIPVDNKFEARRAEGPHRSRPVERLRSEIDRLLDDFLRGYWHVPFRRSALDIEPYWRGQVTIGATPAVDIVERDDGYTLSAELPGIAPQDVTVRFADDTLTIEGDKREVAEDEKRDHFLSERRYGHFFRSFRVPNGVDADKIEASFSNGVLTVRLPKTPGVRQQGKKIAIRAG